MANDPRTLFERLNDLLEELNGNLTREIGGTSTNTQPAQQGGEREQPIRGSWSWLEDLLKRLFGDLGNKVSSPSSGNSSAPTKSTNLAEKQQWGIPPIRFSDNPNVPALELQKDVDKRDWQKYGEHKTQSLGDLAEMTKGMESQTGQGVESKVSKGVDTAQMAVRAVAGDPTAIVGLIDKAIKQVEERFAAGKQSIEDIGSAMGEETIGKAGGKMFDAAQNTVKAAGLEGTPVDTMLQFGKAVAESVDRLRDMSREMINMNFRLGEYSASMATAEAEQEVRDIGFSMEKGDARADSTAGLAEAMSELNETLMPLENAWANFSNETMANIVRMVTMLMKITPTLDTIKSLLELITWKNEEEDDDRGDDYMKFLLEQGEKYGRPKRIPPS